MMIHNKDMETLSMKFHNLLFYGSSAQMQTIAIAARLWPQVRALALEQIFSKLAKRGRSVDSERERS